MEPSVLLYDLMRLVGWLVASVKLRVQCCCMQFYTVIAQLLLESPASTSNGGAAPESERVFHSVHVGGRQRLPWSG